MGILRNRVNRRFPLVGLVSDVALVGAAANRLARRGRNGSGSPGPASSTEIFLAGGAALRLVQRWRRRRRRRRHAQAAAD